MDTNDLLEMLKDKKAVEGFINECLEYGPLVKKVFSTIISGTVDLRIQTINQFKEAGFSREEAIMLTMDEWFAIKKVTRAYNKK